MELTYRKIIVTAILIIIGISLFPPFVISNTKFTFNRGYHFILSPPHERSNVNVALLLAQVSIVSLITCAACFLKSKEKDSSPSRPKVHLTPERMKSVDKMLGTSLGYDPPEDHPKKEGVKNKTKSPALTSFKWAAVLSLSYTTIPIVTAVWYGHQDLGGFLAQKLMAGIALFLILFIAFFLWNLAARKRGN